MRKPEGCGGGDWWLQINDSESTHLILKQHERRGRWVGAVGGICWPCSTVMGGKWTQNYSEVLRGILRYSVEGEATGRAAKWAKDGEIKSGSLW